MPLCLLLATAGGRFGADQQDERIEKEIADGYYPLFAKAMKQKDLKPLFALMTKDATFKEPDGR